METINKFIDVIGEMSEFFDGFQLLEKEKLEAVRSNNIRKLEECMKKEQAEILALRGLEKKQTAIQKTLGYEGLTFKAIIDLVPGMKKDELEIMYSRLSNSLEIFTKTTDSVKKAIDTNLSTIDDMLDVKKESNGREAVDGNKTKKSNHSFTSKKV
ncbi:MAG: flagellar export chaperone FlgN [Proteocatella sp.]